ncbi:hypothetical protein AX16_003540 [Volvariella volvacea WC 439]|nr:hypothetical protein AX16_003540 [Volvariella volvacea WC 439]
MPSTFTYTFDTPAYKGATSFNTGLFIGGKYVDPVEPATIDAINPSTGEVITTVLAGSSKDIDIAAEVAKKAYKTSWGLKVSGVARGRLLYKFADLLEKHRDELAALETLNSGKTYANTFNADVPTIVGTFRYYAGWADKISGKTQETSEDRLTYTRVEPYGVVGQIIPWNFPLAMLGWKIAPALAAGNVVIIKPSEFTPLTALRIAELFNEAGFPPGVVNIVNGYGHTVGQAITEHPLIEKVSFTGSTVTGRRILKASADSNIKDVSLELGGKSPTIIFDDANLEQAVKWAAHGIFFNMGQGCICGSRIFVQEGIYDEFLEKFTAIAQQLTQATGDPFASTTQHGPQVSQTQFDRIMGYINSGKADGATVHYGGERHGDQGYFIKPTIFTNAHKDMKIVKEEIFGPVVVVFKFKTEEDVIEQANDTVYGLGCHLFSESASRAIRVAHAIESGQVWVNFALYPDIAMPFGGYKQSGIGREMGEWAIEMYTQVKAVHLNLGMKL